MREENDTLTTIENDGTRNIFYLVSKANVIVIFRIL